MHTERVGMEMVRGVPEWVQRSRLVVAGTEDFLLWLHVQTGSPEALGSRVALAWIGGITDEKSPMIHRPAEPTKRRTIIEFDMAAPISRGEPYPEVKWFAQQGMSADEVPSRGFWEAHAGYESTRSYARGVAVALGWVVGVIGDPTLMAPVYRGDGSTLSEEERQECGRTLHTLSVRPLPPPPRPRLRPRPTGAASWVS